MGKCSYLCRRTHKHVSYQKYGEKRNPQHQALSHYFGVQHRRLQKRITCGKTSIKVPITDDILDRHICGKLVQESTEHQHFKGCSVKKLSPDPNGVDPPHYLFFV